MDGYKFINTYNIYTPINIDNICYDFINIIKKNKLFYVVVNNEEKIIKLN
jgi:hypothetical protein